jgi:hypothetical protein
MVWGVQFGGLGWQSVRLGNATNKRCARTLRASAIQLEFGWEQRGHARLAGRQFYCVSLETNNTRSGSVAERAAAQTSRFLEARPRTASMRRGGSPTPTSTSTALAISGSLRVAVSHLDTV